jgi:hypothetical protein
MNNNVGKIDRVIRVLLGAALILWAVLGKDLPYSYIGWIGIIPLLTGVIGWCGLYKILGINSANS